MKRLIRYSLNQPLLVLIATLLFIISGVIAFRQLPVEAFPDVTDTQVTVIALYPGAAAEEAINNYFNGECAILNPQGAEFGRVGSTDLTSATGTMSG